jgi:hypothetical protein
MTLRHSLVFFVLHQLKKISPLQLKSKLLYCIKIHFLSSFFVEPCDGISAQLRFLGNISDTWLVLAHQADKVTADHDFNFV